MFQISRWKRLTIASNIILSALGLARPLAPQAFAIRIATALLASAIVCATLPTTTVTAADSPPRWAYPENNPNYKPPVDDGTPVRAPNSTAGYTWTQLRDRFIAPIWHPDDHRPLPARKTPTSPGFRRATLFNKWLTLRPARAPPPSPAACRRA